MLHRPPTRSTIADNGRGPDRDVSSSSAAQSGQTRPRKRVLLAQLAKPLRAFMATEVGSAGLLLTVTVLALIWANSPLSESYEALWSTGK